MAKFKCKVCHEKFKVSDRENAYEEIKCGKLKCPLLPKQTITKAENFSPREAMLLNFDNDFDPEPFNIITSWESPEVPKIHVMNDDDYSGYC